MCLVRRPLCLNSLQATNRMYVCPGEIVTYVCNGTGDQIRLSAPPYVTVGLPLSYARGDLPGLGRIRNGSIVSNLISTDSPLMVADLIVQNPSLPEFSVRCTVPPSDEAVAQHKPSGTLRLMHAVSKQSLWSVICSWYNYSPSTQSRDMTYVYIDKCGTCGRSHIIFIIYRSSFRCDFSYDWIFSPTKRT